MASFKCSIEKFKYICIVTGPAFIISAKFYPLAIFSLTLNLIDVLGKLLYSFHSNAKRNQTSDCEELVTSYVLVLVMTDFVYLKFVLY